jgi:hypothetical protein
MRAAMGVAGAGYTNFPDACTFDEGLRLTGFVRNDERILLSVKT